MKKIILYVGLVAGISTAIASGGLGDANWITGNDGRWFDANNWSEGEIPTAVDQVNFGSVNTDFTIDQVDIDNNGLGVDLPNSVLQLERKIVFSDDGAVNGADKGSPIDDALVFNRMNINGSGGAGVVFNVPVTANVMTSNRHGGVFNEIITVNSILAISRHQDNWQINASATAPINYLLLDEDRGPDGGNTDGSFNINSNVEIDNLDHVWGRLRVAEDSQAIVQRYHYFDYTNEAENNSINPININGTLAVDVFVIYDTATETNTFLEVGSYGSMENETTTFQLDFIIGDGLLFVLSGEGIFKDGFDGLDCSFNSSDTGRKRGC